MLSALLSVQGNSSLELYGDVTLSSSYEITIGGLSSHCVYIVTSIA